jgi:hypothetical protein
METQRRGRGQRQKEEEKAEVAETEIS